MYESTFNLLIRLYSVKETSAERMNQAEAAICWPAVLYALSPDKVENVKESEVNVNV